MLEVLCFDCVKVCTVIMRNLYIVFQFYVAVELKEGTAKLLAIFGEGRYAMSSVKVGQL